MHVDVQLARGFSHKPMMPGPSAKSPEPPHRSHTALASHLTPGNKGRMACCGTDLVGGTPARARGPHDSPVWLGIPRLQGPGCPLHGPLLKVVFSLSSLEGQGIISPKPRAGLFISCPQEEGHHAGGVPHPILCVQASSGYQGRQN